MNVWQAILLGAVQGFSEFLPISSSGHLILLQRLFGIQENALFYSVMLHFGTLIPVLIVLFKEVLELFKPPFKKLWFLIIATIPAGVIGLALKYAVDIESVLMTHPYVLSILFTITGTALLIITFIANKKQLESEINFKTALFMGLGQACGVVSGISRSGATITAGTLAGVKNERNASFTFLMSIPIIVCAIGLEGIDCITGGIGEISIIPLIVGVVTAMVCGYVAIKWMLKVIKKANYTYFSIYLYLIAIVNLIV